jgi:hypothetical protein
MFREFLVARGGIEPEPRMADPIECLQPSLPA